MSENQTAYSTVVSLDDFRKDVMRTFPSELFRDQRRDYLAMKLVEESAETMQLISKAQYQHQALPTERIKEELGDVLCFWIMLAGEFELKLDDILQASMKKRAELFPVRKG